MSYVLNALLPICFIIFVGYAFKHMQFPSTDFWPKMDKFTYYVLMPCLLVYELAVAKIDLTYTVNLVLVSLLGIFIILIRRIRIINEYPLPTFYHLNLSIH